ncbi:hypothetical protein BESB_027210 [Besnoitia besnoiti]|uniref:Uncharacterized protein n=1 Tax=Besnoitia besnoiti TaxID=94643 RepID=A0A2A9M5X0_BESBE|nr:uncharacterized protein BESB_027210 [Besnoitia besnoiti]PFH31286.1 hypothetical protein BESB_027210 [Besnoitia besnoiti]
MMLTLSFAVLCSVPKFFSSTQSVGFTDWTSFALTQRKTFLDTLPSFVFARGQGDPNISHAESIDESDFSEETAQLIQDGIVFSPSQFDFDAAYDKAKKASEKHVIWDIYHVDQKMLGQKLRESMEKYIFDAYLALRRSEPELRQIPIIGNARLIHFLRSLLTRRRIKTTKTDEELSRIFPERPRLFPWIPDIPVRDSQAENHDEL